MKITKASDSLTAGLLKARADEKMTQIAALFPEHYKFTLVARNTNAKYADADFITTNDELDLTIEAINKLKSRPECEV